MILPAQPKKGLQAPRQGTQQAQQIIHQHRRIQDRPWREIRTSREVNLGPLPHHSAESAPLFQVALGGASPLPHLQRERDSTELPTATEWLYS